MTKTRMFVIAVGGLGVVYGTLLLTGIACTTCDWMESTGLGVLLIGSGATMLLMAWLRPHRYR